MLVIYSNQTESEKLCEQTTDHNGVGFTGVDAEFLTSLAKQYKKRGWLSDKQMKILFKRMPKYSGQLQKEENIKKEQTLNKFKAKFS